MNVMYIIGQNLILIAIAIRATQVWLHSPNSIKRIPDINIRVGFIMEPAAEVCAQTSMHCSTLLRPSGARRIGERSPRHRGCALCACLLPELLSASGALQHPTLSHALRCKMENVRCVNQCPTRQKLRSSFYYA